MKLRFYSVLVCALILSACSSDDDGSDIITAEDIRNEFQSIEVEPGIQDVSLQISSSLSYNFRVIFPDVDLTMPVPLVMALHYDAAGDPEVHKETACYVEPGLEELEAIIISPNGGQTVWGTQENQDKIRLMIELSTQYWPIDFNRIAVMGYSSGGNGSWFFAETQPQVFSAGIAMASGYNVFRPDMTVRIVESPMYVIHGEEDDFFPIDTVQYWVNQTIQAGSQVEFIRAPGLGHYQPCDYVPYLEDAAIWLRDEIWK